MADLESDIQPPATPPVAEATPPAAPPVAAPPEEPDAVDLGGQKMVPLAALHAEREKGKTLKAKADNFDQASGYLEALRPQLEYLRAHPEVMYQATQPEKPAAPATDPELVELAQMLDLYTRDSQPDVERAAKLMKVVDRKAAASAQQLMQPMQQQTARDKAIANFNQVSALPGMNQEALKQLWNATSQQPGGTEMLADPNIAYVYAAAVRGHEQLQAPVVPAPSAPPLITEAAGDRQTPFNRQPPTDLQQRVMAVRGIDSKRYADLTKSFKPGVTNTLEEDMAWPTKAEREAKAAGEPPPAKKKPNISVLERRLKNPFGEPSTPIALSDDSYEVRWFNADLAADHIWRAKYKGWEGVSPSELADPEQLGAFQTSPDGFVVRGAKGNELLMKMPKEWRQRIQAAKTEANRKQMRPGATKQQVANAAGEKYGDDAHDFIQKARLVGDVVDQHEIIHRRVPVEGEASE